MPKHNDPNPPLPDILRSTELCDFGESFARGRWRPKALGLLLAVVGLWALGQFAPQQTLHVALDSVFAATSTPPSRD